MALKPHPHVFLNALCLSAKYYCLADLAFAA